MLVAGGATGPDCSRSSPRTCRCLDVSAATIGRYERDGSIFILAAAERPVRVPSGPASREAVIDINGSPWGSISVTADADQWLAADIDERLGEFAELIAIAIANARGREDLLRLADEQAALRRVATLVAQGAAPDVVFAAVAVEAARVLDVPSLSIVRYDADTKMLTLMANTHRTRGIAPLGTQYELEHSAIGHAVIASGRPARIDDWSGVPGPIAAAHLEQGFGQSVGTPIIVDGTTWGYFGAHADIGDVLPPGFEDRLADFTHLMVTVIANAQARDEGHGLAEEQGALRRVATLITQAAEPTEIFDAVAVEAARVLGVASVSVIRVDAGSNTVTQMARTHGARSVYPIGVPIPVGEPTLGALVVQTERAMRLDDWAVLGGTVAAAHLAAGYGQSVAAPIIVGGALWGYVEAYAEAGVTLAYGSETRLAEFTELVASAISNAQVQDELRGLAEKQGTALRRVATLVAQQAPPSTIFTAVATEASRRLE